MENQEQNIGSGPIINQNQIPTPTPRKSKKLAVVLIIFGLLLIAATGPFLYVKYFTPAIPIQNLNTNTQTTTIDEFADWKTYRNEEYGFEFRYPNYWILEESDNSVSLDSPENYADPLRRIEILVTFDKNPKSLSAKEYYDGQNGISAFDNPEQDSEITIDNNRAYRLYPNTGISPGMLVLIPLENIFIRFDTLSERRDTSMIFDQILSTFKFISTSTASMSYEDLVKSLPLDPGEAGKKTLEGIDSDGDGVRDDVQRWIVLNYPNSIKKQEGLKQLTRALSLYILSSNKTQATEANYQRERAVGCLYLIDKKDGPNNIDSLKNKFLNTEQRLLAYYKSEELKGTSSGIEDSRVCNFDPDLLPN